MWRRILESLDEYRSLLWSRRRDDLDFVFYYWDSFLSVISLWHALLNLNRCLFLVLDHDLVCSLFFNKVISLIRTNGIIHFVVILPRNRVWPLFLLNPSSFSRLHLRCKLAQHTFKYKSKGLPLWYARQSLFSCDWNQVLYELRKRKGRLRFGRCCF